MTPNIRLKNRKPDTIVVDNFLDNPMDHRRFALGLEYEKKGSYGVRSKQAYPYPQYKLAFQNLLGRKITVWENGYNGCYQWCNRHQEIVYHVDGQSFAAAIYLTPEAPPGSGTSFWRSKYTKEHIYTGRNGNTVFGPNGEHFLEPDHWELVDRIGNVFNRLVIWKGNAFHSASSYFGEEAHDSRLFQIFFFDCE